MTLLWLIEILKFYFVVTYHVKFIYFTYHAVKFITLELLL